MNLFEQVNVFEQKIWKSNNRKAILEWDVYSDDLLFKHNSDTWDKLPESNLNDAITTAQEVVEKYKL